MKILTIGDKAPSFTLPRDTDGEISLKDYRGKKVVLYFYPKDDTPGCTKESCGFNDNLNAFNALNTDIIGISKCSVKKHNKFKEKYGLTFPLASDENSNICEQYGTWAEKSMYGKKYMGIERTTFLIDENGNIAHIWNKVKVANHIEEVLTTLKA